MPRRETDLQRENRLVRDGYDVRSYNAVHDQVKVRMEKLQKELALVERLRRSTEELAGSPGDPREFAALDSLIMQVGELKKKHVGPEPFRLVKRAKKILAAKRAVFFRSASSRPQTAPEPKAGGVAGSKSAPSLGAWP